MKQLPNVNSLTNDKFVGQMLQASSSSSPTEQPVPDNRIRVGADICSRERLVGRMFKDNDRAYDALGKLLGNSFETDEALRHAVSKIDSGIDENIKHTEEQRQKAQQENKEKEEEDKRKLEELRQAAEEERQGIDWNSVKISAHPNATKQHIDKQTQKVMQFSENDIISDLLKVGSQAKTVGKIGEPGKFSYQVVPPGFREWKECSFVFSYDKKRNEILVYHAGPGG